MTPRRPIVHRLRAGVTVLPAGTALGAALILGLALFVGARTNTWLASMVAAVPLLALCQRPELPPTVAKGMMDAVWGVAVGVACSVATWLVAPPLMEHFPWFAQELRAMYGLLAHRPGPLLALPILILLVLAEELLFRDNILRGATRRWGVKRAIALAWGAYVLPQLATGTVTMPLVAFGLGGLWTAQRLWHGSLIAPLATHLTWNILVLVARPVLSV